MRTNYWVGQNVYLPARFSTVKDAILTADIIGVRLAPHWTATVRLANGLVEMLSFEDLDDAFARVQELRRDDNGKH